MKFLEKSSTDIFVSSGAKSILSGFLGLSFILSAQVANAGFFEDLTPQQKQDLKQGRQVAVFEEVSNAPWPATHVYQRVDGTPEEAAAVFYDYERHKEFFPDVARSEITNVIDPVTCEVDYELNIEVSSWLPSIHEAYTVRDHLSTYDGGKSYKIQWSLVRSESAKRSEGSAQFESVNGATFMYYRNFVYPTRMGSSIGWVVDGVKETAKKAGNSVADRVRSLKSRNPKLLEQELRSLRESLNH